MSIEIRIVSDRHRYELFDDGTLAAFMEYSRAGGVLDLVHTETLDGFTERGLAGRLVAHVLDDAREHEWQVRPSCPFVAHYLTTHPDQLDLVAETDRAPLEADAD